MQVSVALRARAKLALLLNSVLHAAWQGNDQEQIDPRNLRTFRQLLLALLAKRTTRLLTLAQAILSQRRAASVKAVAMGLGYFLEKAKLPMEPGLLLPDRGRALEGVTTAPTRVLVSGHLSRDLLHAWSIRCVLKDLSGPGSRDSSANRPVVLAPAFMWARGAEASSVPRIRWPRRWTS